MHRFAVLLLGALVAAAGGLLAATSPFPRPGNPWVTGWDKPVDLLGGCRFDRQKDRLAISAPANERDLESAARLLREVEGAFVVQVRVGGNFQLAAGKSGCCAAGILVTAGKTNPALFLAAAVWGHTPQARYAIAWEDRRYQVEEIDSNGWRL